MLYHGHLRVERDRTCEFANVEIGISLKIVSHGNYKTRNSFISPVRAHVTGRGAARRVNLLAVQELHHRYCHLPVYITSLSRTCMHHMVSGMMGVQRRYIVRPRLLSDSAQRIVESFI